MSCKYLIAQGMVFLFLLSGCGSQKVVPSPVLVEVEGPTKYIPVPAEHLVLHQKTTYDPGILYSEAMRLWNQDRGTIDKLLGQIRAIESLNDGTISGDNH